MNALEMLREAYPNKNIESIEVYEIDRVIYVPTRLLELEFNVTNRTIMDWQKKGLKKSEYSLPRFNLFDLEYVRWWYERNIDQRQSRRNRGKRHHNF